MFGQSRVSGDRRLGIKVLTELYDTSLGTSSLDEGRKRQLHLTVVHKCRSLWGSGKLWLKERLLGTWVAVAARHFRKNPWRSLLCDRLGENLAHLVLSRAYVDDLLVLD